MGRSIGPSVMRLPNFARKPGLRTDESGIPPVTIRPRRSQELSYDGPIEFSL